MGYVTQFSAKYAMAQKALKNKSQAFSSSEVIVKPDNSESLLANNKSNPRKELINVESSSNMESDLPVIYFFEAMRKTSRKCKQSINKPSATKNGQKRLRPMQSF